MSRIQQDIFEKLAHDVAFEDIAAVPPVFGGHQRDTLVQAKGQGFGKVIAFVYAMNPELRLFAFPQPRLRMMIDTLRYARNAGLDGADGYRLAPHGRVLNDFVFMRLAWNPELTCDQLVNIDRAARLFDEAKTGESSYELEYTADMLSLLPGIHRLSQPGLAPAEAEAIRKQLFTETQRRYILQGFGSTDYQWVPEAEGYFRAFLGMCTPVPLSPPPPPQSAVQGDQKTPNHLPVMVARTPAVPYHGSLESTNMTNRYAKSLAAGKGAGQPEGLAFSRVFPCALLLVSTISLCTGTLAAGALTDELAAIRGANYTPSYASTSVGAWLNYDADVVERELAYAQRLQLNSVRVFLSTVVYEHDPEAFRQHVADLVARCHAHKLRPLFVLFDSCFGLEPSLDRVHSETWVNNPGYNRLGKESWPALENYVRAVVQPLCGDARVLGWDIMNEPMADFEHVTRAERDVIWEFVRHFCRFVKQVDPDHPITVGHAAAEYIPRTSDLVDFVSLHSYSPRESWFRADIDLARRYGAEQGKPMVITECGSPGNAQPYPLVFRIAGEERVGFFFWELMIGQIMFRDSQGVIYPDGTTRDPETVAALLGFSLKSDGVPLKAVPDFKTLEEQVEQRQRWPELLQQAAAAPRTAAGINPVVVSLASVVRVAARPSGDAAECFELGLSIPHLFRLGKEAEAIECHERLLQLARKWMVAE